MDKKYTTQNNSRTTLEITHHHKQKFKQSMTVNHTSFIYWSNNWSWIRTNLCWSNFQIIGHTSVFKIRKCLHNRYRKPVTCVTTAGVDEVQTMLPDVLTNLLRVSWGIICHSCCRIWNIRLMSIARGWLACAWCQRRPGDAQLAWDQVNVLASPCRYPAAE